MAEIAVIIVNYGTADLALSAVESVFARDHGGWTVEVHLVDNASPGDDAERIRQRIIDRDWTDRIVFYAETENLGFGRGNNVVLEALAVRPTPPRYVFLLNPDARLKTATIATLAGFLEANPDAAVAGAGIDRPDGGPAVSAAFRFPGFVSEFANAARFGPISRLTKRWSTSLPPDAPTQQVDWVPGAALLARFSALLETGFFDPDFFLYFEETELMHRLRKAGWQIWYCPEARVEHVAGAATGIHAARREALPDYWYESWRLYFCKTRGPWGARLCALSRLSGSYVHVIRNRLRGRAPSHAQGFTADFYRLSVLPLFRKIENDV
ncbi:glycosyltransferase family 2 protein [Roseibacterium sp. SDUM158017]|uniref:glycosyltransferase family 2 protein n=1 Tax=Roseicyclus salinarum TaxID=3036773 RepID=UPI002415877C|nr:glycosyltransferase family 2 protein [Roseibacterium sp. SDUM158017]MDG4649642.1 glycosyltransferase family 2 protein [Roseibacterium sp. SDUM158017]